MVKTSVAAILLTGVVGLTGAAFAQGVAPNGGGVGGAIGGRDVIGTTPADNKVLAPSGDYVVTREVTRLAPGEFIVSRNMQPDGSMVEVRRISDADGHMVETTRIYEPGALNFSGGMTRGRNVSGGVGGAIGGRNINGTTPADNAPLPWWLRS